MKCRGKRGRASQPGLPQPETTAWGLTQRQAGRPRSGAAGLVAREAPPPGLPMATCLHVRLWPFLRACMRGPSLFSSGHQSYWIGAPLLRTH